jgi:hypothetical protein
VIDVPKTVQRRLGEELLNLEAFSSAYYTLTGPRTISLKFTDGTRREYQGEACDLVMSVLSERTNIIEIARESGAELFSAQNVRNVAFSHKTSREESFLLVESLADESPISVRGSEAEAVWEQLRRILKPSILATKPRQSTARTGTED